MMFCEEGLGKGGGSHVSLGVRKSCLVEGFGDGCASPYFHFHSGDVVELLEYCFLPLEQKLLGSFSPVHVHPDTFKGHIYQGGKQRRFEVPYIPEIFLGELVFQVCPQLQGDLTVTLAIRAHKNTRQ